MRLNFTSKLLVAALCGCAYAPAFAQYTYIVEGGPGGQHTSSYTDASFAASSGTDTAAGCTATGTRYSGTGTYFGPSRYAQATFTPATSGYYQIDLSWPSTAGQISTAVNLYTGAATGGPTDRWGNTGGPVGVITSGTMNMYYANINTWDTFTTAQLNAGTAYHVGLYGGYKTPYAGGVTPADGSANRVAIGGFRFMAATPVGVTYTGLANHATDVPMTGTWLSWTAGSQDSFCNVWFGTSAGSLTEIGAGLSASTVSLNLDSQNLQGGTQYFWKVDAGNVDVTTAGTVYDFTTVAVPEPSTAVLSLLGGLGTMVWMSRRRAA